MTINQFFSLLTQFTLILIGVITLVDYLRFRRKGDLDVVLMFGGLGLIGVFQLVETRVVGEYEWFRKIDSLLLVAHPYLLLRLVHHLRPVPASIRTVGMIGMVGSWLAVLVFPAPLPALMVVVIVIYFAFIEIYASLALVRGALTTSGVTHWRLLFAALGSGFLAFAIILAGVNAAFPAAARFLAPVIQLMGVFFVLSYFVGFTTPAWLLRTWQFIELHQYLQSAGGGSLEEPAEATLLRLCASSERAVGGFASGVAVQDEASGNYRIEISTGQNLKKDNLIPDESKLTGVLRDQKSDLIHLEETDVASLVEANNLTGGIYLLSVPIRNRENTWGFLLVLLWNQPLFPKDDLALLTLYVEHTALLLGYIDLLERERQYASELEQRVEERTEQLKQLNEELQKSAKDLVVTNKELESFAYSVSHDLRAPLRAIDGFSQILLKKHTAALDDEAQSYFSRIIKNTKQMEQLINDLLSFSRLGRQAMSLEMVHAGEIVRNALSRLEHEIESREVNVFIAELPACRADYSLMTQVFINLISNAIKFTRGRENPCVEIGCTTVDGEYVFHVKDNGAGFSMEYVDKLFGVFQRLHRAEEYEGTGVGLANVQRIIHRHGGRVWAEGVVDEGATFYFSIPR